MKKTVWAFLALAPLVLLSAGCAATTTPAKSTAERMAVLSQQLAQNDLELFWHANLPLNENGTEKVRDLYVRPGRIYALTTDNRLLTLDAFSGRFLWSASLGSADLTTTPVAQLGRSVAVIAILDHLYAFDADDGARLYSRDLKRSPSTALVAHGEYVYFGTNEGWIDAVNIVNPALNWDRRTNSAILATPVADDMHVYFANIGGEIFCSAGGDRNIRWQYPDVGQDRIGAVEATLKRTPSGLILVPCRDYSLYAINPSNGMPAWVCTVGDPILQPAYPVGNRIYVVKEGGVMLALDEADGTRPLWARDGVKRFIAADAAVVYVLQRSGSLAALSPDTGEVRFEFGLPEQGLLSVNENGSELFAANDRGEVVAVRKIKGEEMPKRPEAAAPEATAP